MLDDVYKKILPIHGMLLRFALPQGPKLPPTINNVRPRLPHSSPIRCHACSHTTHTHNSYGTEITICFCPSQGQYLPGTMYVTLPLGYHSPTTDHIACSSTTHNTRQHLVSIVRDRGCNLHSRVHQHIPLLTSCHHPSV